MIRLSEEKVQQIGRVVDFMASELERVGYVQDDEQAPKPRWLVNQLSRQASAVAQRRAEGRCITCGEDAQGYARCAVCRVKNSLSVQQGRRRAVEGR